VPFPVDLVLVDHFSFVENSVVLVHKSSQVIINFTTLLLLPMLSLESSSELDLSSLVVSVTGSFHLESVHLTELSLAEITSLFGSFHLHCSFFFLQLLLKAVPEQVGPYTHHFLVFKHTLVLLSTWQSFHFTFPERPLSLVQSILLLPSSTDVHQVSSDTSFHSLFGLF